MKRKFPELDKLNTKAALRLVKRFEESGSVEDRQNSNPGRPRPARTEDAIERTDQKFGHCEAPMLYSSGNCRSLPDAKQLTVMTSLKDKIVLITGSGDEGGIGAITALHLVQFGPKLALTGRNQDKLEKVGKLVQDKGQRRDDLLLVVADVTVDSDLQMLVQKAIDKFQRLDVLINNAAIVAYHTVLDTPMEEFDHVMRTNLRSAFYLTKLCLPYLIQTKGCIVNVSSISGQKTYTGEASYGISKAGLDHFTGILAMEVAKNGVRVNSVNPGVIRTGIQKKGGMTDERYAEYTEQCKLTHPLGGMGEPEDVAKAITFLASDDSAFITGELLFVDGGRHKQPV